MRLSTKSHYGVRAVFDIAYHGGNYPTQIKDISKRQKISPRYLEQIFLKLKKAGILKSQRGPQGGYYLAKPSIQISVGDVIRAAEGPIELVYCVNPRDSKKRCDLISECVTMAIWKEVGEKIMNDLDSVTIDDLCAKGERMGIEKEFQHRLMYFI